MKYFFYIYLIITIVLQQSFAQTVVVGTIKDSITGSNILSGSIEFIPIDTPKTNSLGEILFGYKTIAYINNGKFSAVLTEGVYNCIVGPFNITKPITIPAGDNIIDLATIYGNTDNSLVTFFQFNTLSNALASMITGSVLGVVTFNGRSGTITLTSNDVYSVDIAAEKIKFTSDSYVHDTNVLAFAVLSVDSELSAATNARSLIVQSLGVDPATNAVNSITNNFATTNYVNDAVYNATNGLSTGSMDYTVTNHFATTNYVDAAIGEATDYTDSAILDFLNNTLSDAATTPIVNITNGLATIAYVNTATNNFITIANAQSLTNNFATKVYAESLTNNFNAANLTGTIDAARLGSGTANSTTVLYGDQVWRTPPTSGGGSICVLGVLGAAVNNTTTYLGNFVNSAESWAQIPMPKSGTIKNFHANIRYNSGSGAVLCMRTNGVDSNIIINTSAGNFYSSNETVPIALGDKISVRMTTTNTTSIYVTLSFLIE